MAYNRRSLGGSLEWKRHPFDRSKRCLSSSEQSNYRGTFIYQAGVLTVLKLFQTTLHLLENPSLFIAAALAAFELFVFAFSSVDVIANHLSRDGMMMLVAVQSWSSIPLIAAIVYALGPRSHAGLLTVIFTIIGIAPGVCQYLYHEMTVWPSPHESAWGFLLHILANLMAMYPSMLGFLCVALHVACAWIRRTRRHRHE